MENPIKKREVSARKFRDCQDLLGLDDLDMARLIGVGGKRPNQVRRIKAYRRSGEQGQPIPASIATVLWYVFETGRAPDWCHPSIQSRVLSAFSPSVTRTKS